LSNELNRQFAEEMQMANTRSKMFTILRHKGNANQNYIMIPSHFSHSGCHQEHKQQMQARMLG
jgi:hypothetical protein